MTEIFVCKPGAINDEDRASLRDAGIVVVQMDDPAAFRLVRSDVEIDGGALLRAAIIALSSKSDDSNFPASRNRRAFFDQLAAAIEVTNHAE